MALTDLVRRKGSNSPERTAWSPFSRLQQDFSRTADDLGRIFDELWRMNGDAELPSLASLTHFSPSIELNESEKNIELTAEVPGMTDKDLKLELGADNRSLTLRGEKKYQHEEKRSDSIRSERAYGAFERTVRLPSAVDPNRVQASVDAGILRVQLDKDPKEIASKRLIPIKSK